MKPVAPVIFVVGPTASGKTDLSYELAHLCSGQVVNADTGQFYEPLTIGTAKPDWRAHSIQAHLFDVCTEPRDFSVVAFRKQLLTIIQELHNQGATPIVVGGSLFYIQSLFFPPQELEGERVPLPVIGDKDFSWNFLNSIDPVRAQAIHPHDSYRIKRALEIWLKTGVQPSTIEPLFKFPFPSYLIVLNPNRQVLWERIEKRTYMMLNQGGWIEEAQKFIDTPWESFITTKGFIGYSKIFDFLRTQPSLQEREKLVWDIVVETRQYAKRQQTFLRGLQKKLLALNQQQQPLAIHELEDTKNCSLSSILELATSLQK